VLNASRFDDTIDYAKFRSLSHLAVIRVYDEAGNVIETHQHSAQSRTAAWDRTTCGFSLYPLCRPVESEGAQASVSVAVLNLESPSVQSVTVASASRDVLQRLQVPNFDA
jgi:hypothetical protein